MADGMKALVDNALHWLAVGSLGDEAEALFGKAGDAAPRAGDAPVRPEQVYTACPVASNTPSNSTLLR